MSRRAWLYVLFVMLVGACVGLIAFVSTLWAAGDVWALVVLAGLATLAQIYRADGPNHQAIFATPVFFFAGALLLPPAQLVILVAIPHLIEWIIARFFQGGKSHLHKWYIQPFNIAMYVLATLAGQYAYTELMRDGQLMVMNSAGPTAMVAAIVYLIVNQAILGQVLVLARNVSWQESGVLKLDSLLPEFIMLCLGIVVAKLWDTDRWLIIPAVIPLVLMYRALKVPQLQQAAQTDSKTGLSNAGHFKERSEEEFARAQRFSRPLCVIMADLDLLRNINNTYGHLAGDAVLNGVGAIIRKNARQYDIAGRFGGEEFSMVMPETDMAYAYEIAERIRREVERAEFVVPTSATPLHVTISIGIAAFPENASTITDLVHEADIAVYQAKYQGRNRVICASEVPHSAQITQEADASLETSSTHYAVALSKAAPQAEPQVALERGGPPPMRQDDLADMSSGQTAAEPELVAAPAVENPSKQPPMQRSLWLFVGVISTLGVAVVSLLLHAGSAPDLVAIMLLVALAVVAEWMQINVYGEHSISVSMSAIMAAALITGMPGLAAASAAVVITNQLRRGRAFSEWYKALFNWSTHILAGLTALTIGRLVHDHMDLGSLALAIGLAALASMAYYLVETALISMAISLARRERVVEIWRAQFSWLATHYVVLGISGLFLSLAYLAMGPAGMLVFALPVLMQRYAQQQYVTRTNANVMELRRMNVELSQANHRIVDASHSIHQLNERLRNVNTQLFQTVGRILDARDPYVAGHSFQVARYAAAIAKELNFPPERVELMYHAGLLHDLGKIAISEQILNKPGRLTPCEYEQMKSHTVIGADLLSRSPGLSHLAPLIRHHHERIDGCGYPDGLLGEEIPLESRILAVCDTVEAMASDRPYRSAEALDSIIEELRRCSGSQFEPAVVEAFVRLVEQSDEQFIVNSARVVHERTGREMVLSDMHPVLVPFA